MNFLKRFKNEFSQLLLKFLKLNFYQKKKRNELVLLLQVKTELNLGKILKF